MVIAEVVDATQDIHTSRQRFSLLGQGARAAGQAIQALSEGGVQSFDKGGVDNAPSLRSLEQVLDHGSRALDNAPVDGQLVGQAPLDNLNDGHIGPSDETRATRLALSAGQRRAKGSLKGAHIVRQAIDCQQYRPTQGYPSHLSGQPVNQVLISLRANFPTQPQAGGDHHCQGHPDTPSLCFDLDFIRLHLLQIKPALTHQMLMHHRTLVARPLPPTPNRPLVQPKGFDNGGQRAPVRQQANHQQDNLRIAAQAIKQTALRHAKRPVAYAAHIPLVLLAMYPNVASPALASCRTVNIGAKYSLWVHWLHSCGVATNRSLPVDPVFSKILPQTTF
jgi:hypothetical protein